MNFNRREQSFGSVEGPAWKHPLRKVAYAPLLLLERVRITRKWLAPSISTDPTGYSLFTRTQGLHGGTIEAAIPFIRRHISAIEPRRVLVLGCGEGREVRRWTREAQLVVGQDVLDFSRSWKEDSCIRSAFVRSDAAALPFEDECFDVVFAKAVFEHLTDAHATAQEIRRTLRNGGVLWADFGPLWHSFDGIHASGFAYDHLLLTDRAIAARLQPGSEAELYWTHGMFSRLRPQEYRTILENSFAIAEWRIAISAQGRRFRRRNPDEWASLLEFWTEEELLTWAIFFLGVKQA